MEKLEFNEEVAGWARLVKSKMIQRVAALTLKDKYAVKRRQARKKKGEKLLVPSLGFAMKKEFGDVVRVNFKFVRHAIFFEHCVGRGRPVRSPKANPHPFLALSIDPAISALADIVAEHYADVAIGEIKFTIPGIINKRVKIQANG